MRRQVSYHPLSFSDMSICAVAVQPRLALPVPSVPVRDGPKLRRRPPPAQPIPSLRILDQPIDFPLKVLFFSQVEVLRLFGCHWLLQHLRVVVGDRLAPGVFKCVLDHPPSCSVEHEACRFLGNIVIQTKMFLQRRNN